MTANAPNSSATAISTDPKAKHLARQPQRPSPTSPAKAPRIANHHDQSSTTTPSQPASPRPPRAWPAAEPRAEDIPHRTAREPADVANVAVTIDRLALPPHAQDRRVVATVGRKLAHESFYEALQAELLHGSGLAQTRQANLERLFAALDQPVRER